METLKKYSPLIVLIGGGVLAVGFFTKSFFVEDPLLKLILILSAVASGALGTWLMLIAHDHYGHLRLLR